MTQALEARPTAGGGANDSLAGERVLVTGASGFIGRHLCARLLGAGARVFAVSRSGRPRDLPRAEPDPLEWRSHDLGERGAAAATMRWARPDRVVHLASLVKGARDRALVAEMFDANVASTVRLLDAAADAGCRRFVHLGSLEEPEAGEWPVSPYAASKAAASLYAELYARLYGLPVATARVFMVYGPGPQDLAKLVPYVITELLAGRAPELSSGRRAVDWVFVEDVAEGLCRMLVDPGAVGERLDLGSGELVTVRELVARLTGLVASGVEPRLGALPDREGEVVRCADVERTAARIGWRPRVGLDEGLRRTVEELRGRVAGAG
ncbi:MAG TPA: SDR family NAD(P)-dependent oxidoreductase [Thermoanaerobaculia bacterium]|nr:SDR family NAD(P)-dependent oxidoreductase [Thermoanaerobaculia bacterium]